MSQPQPLIDVMPPAGSPEYWQRFWAIMAAPWSPDHVLIRQGSGGAMLMYADERLMLERLNLAAGPGNWSREFEVMTFRTTITTSESVVAREIEQIDDTGHRVTHTIESKFGSKVELVKIWRYFPETTKVIEHIPSMVKCRITVLGVVREGVGDESNIDEEKGSASDAFKRACVACGGIFLYFAHILINKSMNRTDLKQRLTADEIRRGLLNIDDLYYDFLAGLDETAIKFHLTSPWHLPVEAMENVITALPAPRELSAV